MRSIGNMAALVAVVALAGCGSLSSLIGNGGGGNTTYTIGGAISGLSATGLVLANGSDTVSPAANATSFVFPTAIASGDTYAVTVSTQPTGETCTVTNGSGTAGSSNVTNVQVACTADTYTIGGTISGLTATGLVLANGTDTVSPAANATSFVFPTAVASGANYSVTVSTQPSGETCTVSNGSGTVGSSNVTSVQVACTASSTATYTIGGTISGLTATGLVLANGADTVSPAANATSFVFPTAVVSGASYSVTVSTQPSGETCTVTNGSGTVGSSNVTSVQVACEASSTGTYTIGGTISGLTASGLVLANGTDTVSPAANATSFVFPTAVVSGASYSVTVSTQPSGETCTVTNGSGAVGSSNVTSIQVACTATGTQTVVPLVVTPAVLPGATSGTSYSQALSASGTGPFTWTGYTIVDTDSSLNPYPSNGLTLSSAGLLSGTPYYTGLQPIAIYVSSGDGASAFVQTELSIAGGGSSQNITNAPPAATQGQPYNWQVQMSWGFTGPNQGCGPGAQLEFGSIPPGLTYNPLNSSAGTLFGTPTMAGNYTLTIMGDPGTTLCAPEPTNYATVTLTIGPASSPTTPAGSSNWTRQGTSAVLAPSTSGWDSYLVGSPSVIKVGSTYNMYYEGLDTTDDLHAIGLATSTDPLLR